MATMVRSSGQVAAQKLQRARPRGLGSGLPVAFLSVVHKCVAGVGVSKKLMWLAVLGQFTVEFHPIVRRGILIVVTKMALQRAMDFRRALQR